MCRRPRPASTIPKLAKCCLGRRSISATERIRGARLGAGVGPVCDLIPQIAVNWSKKRGCENQILMTSRDVDDARTPCVSPRRLYRFRYIPRRVFLTQNSDFE